MTIELPRRGFLLGLLAAPFVVRDAKVLMPVRSIERFTELPGGKALQYPATRFAWIVTETCDSIEVTGNIEAVGNKVKSTTVLERVVPFEAAFNQPEFMPVFVPRERIKEVRVEQDTHKFIDRGVVHHVVTGRRYSAKIESDQFGQFTLGQLVHLDLDVEAPLVKVSDKEYHEFDWSGKPVPPNIVIKG